jgi:hypothetical protein
LVGTAPQAKAKVEGGFEAYAERLRQEKIQLYEDRLAKGGFLPYVAGGRSPRPRAEGLDQARFGRPALLGPHQFPRYRPHRVRTGQGEYVSEEKMIRRAGRLDSCVSTTPQMLSISSLTSYLHTGSCFFTIRRNCSISVLTLT